MPAFTKKIISGKEIISEALPENLNFSEENLKVVKGEFIHGNIDENTFGVEDGILVKTLDKQVGREKTFETIKGIFKLGTNYLTNRGITISVDDLDLRKEVVGVANEIIKKSEEKVSEIIQSYKEGSLEIIPGKTREESREIKILQVLNEIRTKIGDVVRKEFPEKNPVSYMIKSGGGGNILNVTMMASCVGQQVLGGRRIDLGYTERTLSSFKKGDLSPRSRGFIYSPFIKGLRPDEFFFGAVTGRDSLMDTALRTPKSGYLYRRLANALQDLKVEYDDTVRDASKKIIQFAYGEDGIDVSKSEKGTINVKRIIAEFSGK
jgi:DNA-directed RNA polymerase subunit A'